MDKTTIDKILSKTFPGIARAMAEQWAGPAEALKGGESDA